MYYVLLKLGTEWVGFLVPNTYLSCYANSLFTGNNNYMYVGTVSNLLVLYRHSSL